MILEYHRPATISAAMDLLTRKQPRTLPLGGGTSLLLQKEQDFAVVDIQDLALNQITSDGQTIQIGAGTTLQQLLDSDLVPDPLRLAAKQEASFNIRQAATIGGTIAGGSGKSILLSLLLGYNADMYFAGEEKPVLLGEILPLRKEILKNRLITGMKVSKKMDATFEKIAKTPADFPMLIVVVASWNGDRTRVVVGSDQPVPRVAMDGTSSSGAEIAAQNLLTGSDEYLQKMAGLLAKRCLERLSRGGSVEH